MGGSQLLYPKPGIMGGVVTVVWQGFVQWNLNFANVWLNWTHSQPYTTTIQLETRGNSRHTLSTKWKQEVRDVKRSNIVGSQGFGQQTMTSSFIKDFTDTTLVDVQYYK